MDTHEEKQLESLGAFEISDRLITLAKEKTKQPFFNAGRGNPNWVNARARLAFNRLVEFGLTYEQSDDPDLVMVPTTNMTDAFLRFLTSSKTDQFLLQALLYTEKTFSASKEAILQEWVQAVLGDNYPVPSRVLPISGQIIATYLDQVLLKDPALIKDTLVFPTEGGTAAIVYIFQTLKENFLLQKGDKIAMNTPIFTPYLQIPKLEEYELVEIDIDAKESEQWQFDPSELDKLLDPAIKAFFIVNPSNPGAKAFSKAALEKLQQILTQRPDLMILTDDVYGPFVEEFQSVYAIAPHNTLLVYSYSKLFGATGWRLGVIAAHKQNVFDQLLQNLSPEQKQSLHKRYEIVTTTPESFAFLDRIGADSRSVGLYHTSGLSTPQQIMEVLFSLTHLLHAKDDAYVTDARQLIATRYHDLMHALQLAEDEDPLNTKYYTLIDVYRLAKRQYGAPFANYLQEAFEPIDFLLRLAQTEGVILMDGVGFGTKAGEVRISQANLATETYAKVGKRILDVLDNYYTQYKKNH
ncbi:bifunctional aspartate transaminase/aspartate 4-decarboxylase [uncultured Enterococcus sp.]|uniref:bifunctional aspartate transaminase/aspartate 4-decarboxylase n=1 Tax=uncultured Enterococcus sp. TaxID=167972 RepID=UPI0025F709E6|nr:bifunctional aspartate transaminase/aspartate 4-decarboxylase [uncultured Enterococcus sp.]